MTRTVLLKELVGKRVVTGAGSILGTLDDVVVDTATGEMRYLLVRAGEQARPGQRVDSKGRAVYAFTKLNVGEGTVTIE